MTDKQAKAFKSISDYNMFKTTVERLRVADNFELLHLKKDVMQANPVLILIDIGGTLLYRCSGEKLRYPEEKEGGKLREVKLDFSIKRHHHYYRQYMTDFLYGLLTHPRV